MIRKNSLLIICLLALVCASAHAEFKLYEVTWNDPAGTRPAVPVADIPDGVAHAYWTTTNGNVWPDPPTTQQVQATAALALNGGTSPAAAIIPWFDVRTYPAGTFVLLDMENRTDAAVDSVLNRYRNAGGSRAPFAVYGWYPAVIAGGGNFPYKADNHPLMIKGAEERAAQCARIAAKVNALILDVYPQAVSLDETCYRAWDFDAAQARRLFPGKRVYAISRGDRGAANIDALLTDVETRRLARFLRSRFDGCICWGERRNNLALMKAMTDLR